MADFSASGFPVGLPVCRTDGPKSPRAPPHSGICPAKSLCGVKSPAYSMVPFRAPVNFPSAMAGTPVTNT